MDPIEAWVDAQDLRRMAAALLAEPSSTPPDDCLFGTDFVGYGPESRAPAGTTDDEVSLPAQGAEESARRAFGLIRDRNSSWRLRPLQNPQYLNPPSN